MTSLERAKKPTIGLPYFLWQWIITLNSIPEVHNEALSMEALKILHHKRVWYNKVA